MRIYISTLKLGVLFLGVVLFHSCAVNPVTGKKQLMLMSEAKEIQMGKEYDPTVVATFGVYQDDDLQQYINEKGNEMVALSHRSNLDFDFKILDSPVINAFAVPGGYVYFTRGILAHLNSEAEFMGVLGHEIGHVTARHSASQQSKQTLGQVLLIGGMMASEKFQQFSGYASQGMQLLFLKFSRDNEREADMLGVEYSTLAGYDANKMADFFNVLDQMQLEGTTSGIPTFLSTHPDPGERNIKVHQLAETWQDSIKMTSWKVNADTYLKLIDGIVYGEDPRQGFVEEGVFYHPEMKFQFPVPTDWQLQNSPLQVQMAPENGEATIIFATAIGESTDAVADKVIADLGLTNVQKTSKTINGLPATKIISEKLNVNTSTGDTTHLNIATYLIDYNQQIFLFHGLSEASNFAKYLPKFTACIESFKALSDPSKLNVQPQRIKVFEATSNGTLQNILTAFGVQEKDLHTIALLNNLNLTDQIEKGKLLKIISK